MKFSFDAFPFQRRALAQQVLTGALALSMLAPAAQSWLSGVVQIGAQIGLRAQPALSLSAATSSALGLRVMPLVPAAFAAALTAGLTPGTSNAGGVGGIVFDPTNFAEAVSQSAQWVKHHADQLRNYLQMLQQYKTMIDQLVHFKQQAIKDMLGMMGISDLLGTIKNVQDTISAAKSTYSSLVQLRDVYGQALNQMTAGNLSPGQWFELQVKRARVGSQMERETMARRVDLMDTVAKNITKLQSLQSTVGSSSMQSSFDGMNSQLNLVGHTMAQLVQLTAEEQQIQSARRIASDESMAVQLEADRNRQTRDQWTIDRYKTIGQ